MKKTIDFIGGLIFAIVITSPWWMAWLVIVALVIGAIGGLIYLIKGH